MLQDLARQTNGVFDPLQSGRGSRAKVRRVHYDSVALHASVEIQVRTETRVEDRIVFKDHDGGFDSVKRRSPFGKNRPTRSERPLAARMACFDGLIRNVQAPPWTISEGFMRTKRMAKALNRVKVRL